MFTVSHCCDMSNKSKCRDTCKRILSTTETTIQSLVDVLEVGGCGPFLLQVSFHPFFIHTCLLFVLLKLQDFFWQCILQSPGSPTTSVGGSIISRVGIDSAKWHCCQQANNPQCQRLCSKTFSKSWITYWKDFHTKCLNQSSEENLRNCIEEGKVFMILEDVILFQWRYCSGLTSLEHGVLAFSIII